MLELRLRAWTPGASDDFRQISHTIQGCGHRHISRPDRCPITADLSYDMYLAQVKVPIAFGRSVLMPDLKAGSCSGLDLGLGSFGYFTLGGVQNLSGIICELPMELKF